MNRNIILSEGFLLKKDFLTTSILLLINSIVVGCSSHEKTELNPDYAGVGTEIPGGIDARIVPFDFFSLCEIIY
ncbi:MAG TPA: hypothetical protein VIG73_12960 [Cerasibacillus sp.]|uniref:hypothetical protein n=1 Tax=Cerasibacillus sp. TaxID=2498711 RepID=UPI002F3E209E